MNQWREIYVLWSIEVVIVREMISMYVKEKECICREEREYMGRMIEVLLELWRRIDMILYENIWLWYTMYYEEGRNYLIMSIEAIEEKVTWRRIYYGNEVI